MFATKSILAISVIAALAACGGGGGGGDTAVAPVATVKTFDLKSTYVNYLQSSSSRTFSLVGNSSGVAVTGSGSVTIGSLQSSTFAGVPALSKTLTLSGTVSGNGQTVPYSASQQGYYDTNYTPLGSSSGAYSVVTSLSALPTAAKINDAGSFLTLTSYPSSAKAYVTGTSTTSYSLSADTENSAVLKLFTTEKNSTGSVISNSSASYRVTTTNSITPLGETFLQGTTSLTITYN